MVYTMRKYSSSGEPITGPEVNTKDLTIEFSIPVVASSSSHESELQAVDSDGNKQFFRKLTDPQTACEGVALERLVGSLYDVKLVPPIFVLQDPVQPNQSWGPYKVDAVSNWTRFSVEYSGKIEGPFEVDAHARKFTLTYRVTISYVVRLFGVHFLTGREFFWLAPGVGIVQQSFERGPYNIDPWRVLVAAHDKP